MVQAGPQRGRVGVLIVGVVVFSLIACRGPQPKQADGRAASIYAAVIVALVEHSTGTELPVVFVATRQDVKPISLEVQAAVVKDLADKVTVRFVDHVEEAIDEKASGRPVVEGVLLRLGPVAPNGDPVEVDVERYLDEATQPLVTVSVSRATGTWTARVTASVPHPGS
jgi:hypothetical protein